MKFRAKRQSGQALLELAFIVPILLLLAIGVIEIGRYAYISILIGNAARAGAAYGAQSNQQSTCPPPSPCGIQQAAINDFQSNGQSSANLTVTTSTSCGCDAAGTITTFGCTTTTNPNAGKCTTGRWVIVVSVTASGNFSGLFSYPGIPNPMSISRTASMRVQ
jgi:Flp pilus assembly protein TadG